MKKVACWVEAMRLRTLPVSVAGVTAATALAAFDGVAELLPALLCLVFAVLAQVASNFANEYYDFRAGRDRAGREGPRRGVTEGDITPRAMFVATFGTLAVAAAVGCSLIAFGGWWLLGAGIVIALGVLAYSTGPYPLSTHGWGEVAVLGFYGIAPVCLTYYVQALTCTYEVFMASVAFGLMGANVLIINNYRDVDDDRRVGKITLAVRMGRASVRFMYLADAIMAACLLQQYVWRYAGLDVCGLITNAVYVAASVAVYVAAGRRTGRALTPLLGATAMCMLLYSAVMAVGAACR